MVSSCHLRLHQFNNIVAAHSVVQETLTLSQSVSDLVTGTIRILHFNESLRDVTVTDTSQISVNIARRSDFSPLAARIALF